MGIKDILDNCSVILLDIEGTTTSINFVTETLFGYIRKNLDSYLTEHWGEKELEDDVQALRDQVTMDLQSDIEGVVVIPEGAKEEVQEAVKKNVTWQMDLDRKTTALKQLQGHMWRIAYENAEIQGHIYDDVLLALKNWTTGGKKKYIYSSGSVDAQKLLFQYSSQGNLLQYLDGHFDTNVGPKIKSSSYEEISNKIGISPDNVVFFTDIAKEAAAAEEAGMHAIIIERPNNFPLDMDDRRRFFVTESFEGLS